MAEEIPYGDKGWYQIETDKLTEYFLDQVYKGRTYRDWVLGGLEREYERENATRLYWRPATEKPQKGDCCLCVVEWPTGARSYETFLYNGEVFQEETLKGEMVPTRAEVKKWAYLTNNGNKL